MRKIAYPDAWRTTKDDPFERSTAVLIVVVGWGYVVVMMALAEATGAHGSLLGAFVTLMLYGVLPLSLVLYIGGARAGGRASCAVEFSADVDPGSRSEPGR